MVKALPLVVALSLVSGMVLGWMFDDTAPAPLALDGHAPSLPLFDVPCEGNLIRADARLTDENFHGALVLLCVQELDGTLGFVVNHGTQRPVRELLTGAPWEMGLLRRGGPVGRGQGAVLYRRDGTLRITTATTGARFPQSGWARVMRVRDDEILAVFEGYAGWGPGQLEEEIQADGWVLTDLTVDEALGEHKVKVW